jgi:hypothetical protein
MNIVHLIFVEDILLCYKIDSNNKIIFFSKTQHYFILLF